MAKTTTPAPPTGPAPLLVEAEQLREMLALRGAALYRDHATGATLVLAAVAGRVPEGYAPLLTADEAFEYVWEHAKHPAGCLREAGAYRRAAEHLTLELAWELGL